MKTPLRFLARLAIALPLSLPAFATEGGGTSKALGVDTVLSGVIAPSGLRLTSFMAYAEADRTLDGAGNDRANISGFKLEVAAVTARLQYTWSDLQLWGATVETRGGLSAHVDVNVAFDVQTPAGKVHRQGKASGLGDALLAPVMLGWRSPRYHHATGLQFFLPTGKFDKARIANTSRGYYAGGPAYLFTAFPVDGLETSGSLIYLTNRTNRHTNYRSGREVSFDYGVGYDVAPAWQVGANGYLYKQVTDDTLNGAPVAGGNRGQVAAIGPFLRYHPSRDWGVTLKLQHEGLVENRTAGTRVFLQFALKLL